ncbi:unnamed protein product [Timema podura]|uniref:Uncharacterized protein n=1 Tax=Timema podura TaxID=61482 RepID=A0ABN7NF06_TIMPD|nr:unnamed protein product [Timema podura]
MTEQEGLGFGDNLMAALDVMAFTHDIDLSTPTPVSGTMPGTIFPQPAVGVAPGTTPQQATTAVTVPGHLPTQIPPASTATTVKPALPVTQPQKTTAVPSERMANMLSHLGTDTTASTTLYPKLPVMEVVDDPLRQLVLLSDLPNMSEQLAALAVAATKYEDLGEVSPREQHRYCCMSLSEETRLELRNAEMVLQPSDSDGFGEGPLLGRGSRIRRARSARQSRGNTRDPDNDRLLFCHYKQSSSNTSSDSGMVNPAFVPSTTDPTLTVTAGSIKVVQNVLFTVTPLGVMCVMQAVGDFGLNHGKEQYMSLILTLVSYEQAKLAQAETRVKKHNKTRQKEENVQKEEENVQKPPSSVRSRPRPKTARANRVAPSTNVPARRGGSALPIPSVRRESNGHGPAPTSPPDPLDAWSTRDIANMNKLLDEEDSIPKQCPVFYQFSGRVAALNFIPRKSLLHNNSLLMQSSPSPVKPDLKVLMRTNCISATQLTSKFYARHDMIRSEDVEPRLLEMIQEADTHGPKDKYNEPVLESQVYGWYSRPLIAQDRNDRRLHFNRRYEDITKYGSLLRQTDKLIGKQTLT